MGSLRHLAKRCAEINISSFLGTRHPEQNTLLAFSSERLALTSRHWSSGTAGGLSQTATAHKILLPWLKSSGSYPWRVTQTVFEVVVQMDKLIVEFVPKSLLWFLGNKAIWLQALFLLSSLSFICKLAIILASFSQSYLNQIGIINIFKGWRIFPHCKACSSLDLLHYNKLNAWSYLRHSIAFTIFLLQVTFVAQKMKWMITQR